MKEMGVSYTVFAHLLDEGARLWGQQDNVPGRGSLPTTGWLPGEVLVDEYDIEVHPDAPAGELVIELGMYEAVTGQRLPVFAATGRSIGDHLQLDAQIDVIR